MSDKPSGKAQGARKNNSPNDKSDDEVTVSPEGSASTSIGALTYLELTKSVETNAGALQSIQEIIKSQQETLGDLSRGINDIRAAFMSEEDPHIDDQVDLDYLAHDLMDGFDSKLMDTGESSNSNEMLIDWDEILNQHGETEELGEPINEKLADTLSKIPNQSLPSESVQQLKAKYKIPRNCKLLGVPKVNPEIWSSLSHAAKQSDARCQFQQQLVSKSMIAQTKVAQNLMECSKLLPKDLLQDTIKSIVDSVTMLGMVQRDTNSKRKLSIKPLIQPEYADICSSRTQVTEYLFGDDLEATLRQAKASSRIMKATPGLPARINRFSPFARPSLNFRGPFSYRRGSGGHSYRPRMEFTSRFNQQPRQGMNQLRPRRP